MGVHNPHYRKLYRLFAMQPRHGRPLRPPLIRIDFAPHRYAARIPRRPGMTVCQFDPAPDRVSWR
jgi:hypothetical protein